MVAVLGEMHQRESPHLVEHFYIVGERKKGGAFPAILRWVSPMPSQSSIAYLTSYAFVDGAVPNCIKSHLVPYRSRNTATVPYGASVGGRTNSTPAAVIAA